MHAAAASQAAACGAALPHLQALTYIYAQLDAPWCRKGVFFANRAFSIQECKSLCQTVGQPVCRRICCRCLFRPVEAALHGCKGMWERRHILVTCTCLERLASSLPQYGLASVCLICLVGVACKSTTAAQLRTAHATREAGWLLTAQLASRRTLAWQSWLH